MREINTIVCFLSGTEKQTGLFLYLPTRGEEEEQHQSRYIKYYSYKPTVQTNKNIISVNKRIKRKMLREETGSVWFHLENTSQLCSKMFLTTSWWTPPDWLLATAGKVWLVLALVLVLVLVLVWVLVLVLRRHQEPLLPFTACSFNVASQAMMVTA